MEDENKCATRDCNHSKQSGIQFCYHCMQDGRCPEEIEEAHINERAKIVKLIEQLRDDLAEEYNRNGGTADISDYKLILERIGEMDDL